MRIRMSCETDSNFVWSVFVSRVEMLGWYLVKSHNL